VRNKKERAPIGARFALVFRVDRDATVNPEKRPNQRVIGL
jgi:hypothetical protein